MNVYDVKEKVWMIEGSIDINSPLLRPGCVGAVVMRAGRCCKSAGRAADVGPWMQRSEVAGQLETLCSCPGCLTCFPCVGTLLETEGLQCTGRNAKLLT